MSCYQAVLAELRVRFPRHSLHVPAGSVLGEFWIARLKSELNDCLVVVVAGEFGRPLSNSEIDAVESVRLLYSAADLYWLYVDVIDEMKFTWESGD